jgi:hypothetical protein
MSCCIVFGVNACNMPIDPTVESNVKLDGKESPFLPLVHVANPDYLDSLISEEFFAPIWPVIKADY